MPEQARTTPDCLMDFGYTSCEHPRWTNTPWPEDPWRTKRTCDFCGAENWNGDVWKYGSMLYRIVPRRLVVMIKRMVERFAAEPTPAPVNSPPLHPCTFGHAKEWTVSYSEKEPQGVRFWICSRCHADGD
jgi:hypothetical protein